ncbi:dimethylarginine dimethylaminohydrolase family protein [Pantoea sp. App145]|uniref:dimethylarginine dimethylaminohydrolase family protein n=1 Tax=Pantoea sp. App145 TaxID=3071567 RepID=UPI003A7FB08A
MAFTQIIARLPADNCAAGLTTASLGAPDAELTRRQFWDYLNAMLSLRLKVTLLPAEADFPDAHFVEDTAVIVPELAVITHPGAPQRAGEVESIKAVLKDFRPLKVMSERGTLEGGDVMLIDKAFYIGLTTRTNEAGISEFASLVEPYGYSVTSVEVDEGLHLKSAINYVGKNTLISTEKFARLPQFSHYQHLIIPDEEIYAGNTLLINGTLITPTGYPATLAQLRTLDMPIIELDTSEIRKMDGGLTCLSLRF